MKYNILVVMPRFVSKPTDGYVFPLGLPYISSSLKKAGFHVYTLNLNHHEDSVFDVLKQEIIIKNIHVLFTGGLSSQYSTIRQVVESAKIISPEILTVVGGGLVSAEPDISMKALEYADIGIIGEGDITCVELCQVLENGDEYSCVHGLIFKNKETGEFCITPPRKVVTDIDTIPWPDYEGFELDINLSNSTGLFGYGGRQILYMISSRSCPFSCTFCFHTIGSKYRQRSLDDFFQELDYLLTKYKFSAIHLADELFSVNTERVKDFCTRIKKYSLVWSTSFRVDSFNDEIANLVKQTGNCMTVSFGLESADNRILKSMNKKLTIEQIEKVLNLCYDLNLPIQGNFIFGDIAETTETSENTLKWVKRNQGRFGIRLSHVIAYPGTYIYKYACHEGLIRDRIEFLRSGCPQLNISKMSNDEYYELLTKIEELSPQSVNTGIDIDIFHIDDERGSISVREKCPKCNFLTCWEDLQLFQPTYFVCEKCGQKIYPPVGDPVLVRNFENNINKIFRIHNKLAIWGMHDHLITLLKKSALLDRENLFLIDISSNKQGTAIFGKNVYPPNIICEENIPAVIIAAPWYFGDIISTIHRNYPHVVNTYNILNLIGENYLAK